MLMTTRGLPLVTLLLLACSAAQAIPEGPPPGPATCATHDYADVDTRVRTRFLVQPGASFVVPVNVSARKLPGHTLIQGALQLEFGAATPDFSTVAIEIMHAGRTAGVAAAGHLTGRGERTYLWKDDAAEGVDGVWTPYGNRPAESFMEVFFGTPPNGQWMLRVTNIASSGRPVVINNFVVWTRVACDGPKSEGKDTMPPTLPFQTTCDRKGAVGYQVTGQAFNTTKGSWMVDGRTSVANVGNRKGLLGKARLISYFGIRLDIGTDDFSSVSVRLWHNVATNNRTVNVVKAGNLHGSGRRLYWIHDDAVSHITVPFNPNGHRPADPLSLLQTMSSFGDYGLIVSKAANAPDVHVYGWSAYFGESINCVYVPPLS